ncbi:hypothetical protein HDV62DRAFT_111281 [Trichoderma sp. SZMC 28011]
MQGKAKGPCSLASCQGSAAKPRARALSSMQVDTLALLPIRTSVMVMVHGRWHGRMRSADPSSERIPIHAESKASTGHATRTGPAPEARSRSCVPRDAIPKPARSGPSAVTWRREKLERKRTPVERQGDWRMSQKEEKKGTETG